MGRSQQLVTLLLASAQGGWSAPQRASRVVEAEAPPATYTANPDIGPGGSTFKDSGHIRVYGNDGAEADQALAMLEAAHDCAVNVFGFRSPGLSFNDDGDTGAYTKTNIYSVDSLDNAAGVMHSDAATGMAWLEVVNTYLTVPGVTVHEFGHGIHYHQKTWVDQGRTGAWWETFANWWADTYKTSDLCEEARNNHDQTTSDTEIELGKTISDSFQVIVDGSVDTGNYYQAWPFLTYLTTNPDSFDGLGTDALHQMMVQYEAGSNETPLHTLQRVAGGTSAGKIVGGYWAHMAYVDIGHPQAHEVFLSQRSGLNYANVQSSGDGYAVIADRQPQYMGANIIPLTASGGTVTVEITANLPYTATLAVMGGDSFRYIPVDGSGSVEVASGEEVSLVVANTPDEPILYDAFSLSDEVKQGLDYSFTLSGATVA